MGGRAAVIVIVDGLRADALASYGSEHAETPFLDRLSSESMLFDFAFSLDASLEGFYFSALGGKHPCYRHVAGDAAAQSPQVPPLPQDACHHLFSDDPAVTDFDLAPFNWTRVPTGESRIPSAAEQINERLRSSQDETQVAWLHLSLVSTEDVIESRRQYDTLVTAMDEGLRTLFVELSMANEESELLFMIAGCRGYAFGEHGHLGNERPLLHEELLHVPLIVYAPGSGQSSRRVDRLVSPLDVGPLLRTWLEGRQSDEWATRVSPGHHASSGPANHAAADWLYFANALGDQAIRTPGWYLIRSQSVHQERTAWENPSPSPSLYLKPDDRWEFNEVSALRPEIVEGLVERLDELGGQASSGKPLFLTPLPPELLEGR